MRNILIVVLVVLLLVLPGCTSTDLFSQLSGASSYIGTVGQLMQAKGWTDFPADPLSLALYANDLRTSFSEAKNKKQIYTAAIWNTESDLGATYAKPLRNTEEEMPPLNNSFGGNTNW